MPHNYLEAGEATIEVSEKLADAHTDITGAVDVQVLVNRERNVVHVNVNGICVFRACQIQNIRVEES